MFNRLQDNISFILVIGGKEGKKSRCSNSCGRGSPSTQKRGTAYLLPDFLISPVAGVPYPAALALARWVSSALLCFCLKTFSSWPTSSACFLVCSRGLFFFFFLHLRSHTWHLQRAPHFLHCAQTSALTHISCSVHNTEHSAMCTDWHKSWSYWLIFKSTEGMRANAAGKEGDTCMVTRKALFPSIPVVKLQQLAESQTVPFWDLG